MNCIAPVSGVFKFHLKFFDNQTNSLTIGRNSNYVEVYIDFGQFSLKCFFPTLGVRYVDTLATCKGLIWDETLPVLEFEPLIYPAEDSVLTTYPSGFYGYIVQA